MDTGASVTLFRPEVLDDLGYSPRQAHVVTKIRSAVGEEPGYMIRISRFRALGYEVRDLDAHAHDLPEGFGIDGLLGLNFLKELNYEIRSREGRIVSERA